ncbi:MAG: ParA family protein [Planctomycetes bacterium]|nr:ParA family protein [Planctomycetota bacterium]
MRSIAISNQKGGVGKTTTAANLGACIAELGKNVVLVDMDPQANLSIHLGADIDRDEASVYTLIRREDSLEETMRDTPLDNLKVIPSNIDLAGLEVELSTETLGRERCLARVLKRLEDHFDYLVIDCPPSLGLLTLNSMCAVDEIFIPLQTEFFALQGLGRLMRTVKLVQSSLKSSVRVSGIIASMFDVRTSLAIEVLQDIRKHFGKKVFDTVVRKNVRLAEAPSFGLPITLYDSECYGTEDYRSLAREAVAMAGEWVDIPIEDDSTPPLPETEKTTELARAG